MIDWKRKLSSRKFWAALADFVGMLLIALHVAADTATQVTALIMAGAGVVAYILGEGLADAANNGVEYDVTVETDSEADNLTERQNQHD